MSTFDLRLNRILSEVSYKPGWRFVTLPLTSNESTVQLLAEVTCCNTGKTVTLASHKVILDDQMEVTRIIRILYTLISVVEEHERGEFFIYGKRRVYGHHTDINALWYVGKQVKS